MGEEPTLRETWTREGFSGARAGLVRAHHTPEYVAVAGPHAPHRFCLRDLAPPDRDDPEALPLPFMVARDGLRLSLSGRQAPMPFVVANVEADEIYWVQDGALEFETAYGPLVGAAGDFVCLPRGVEHRLRPLETPTLSVVVEVPGAVALEPPTPDAVVMERPHFVAARDAGGETELLLKCFDGVTRYVKQYDPLAAAEAGEEVAPVWRMRYAASLAGCGGPPQHFAASPGRDALVYNLSARPGRRRPPIHHNVDYDEIIVYVGGPGAYGQVTEPGTLTWVPKGVAHQGPSEDVPEGYVAWMLESRSTLRLTPAGLAAAELMELDQYGRHPAVNRRELSKR